MQRFQRRRHTLQFVVSLLALWQVLRVASSERFLHNLGYSPLSCVCVRWHVLCQLVDICNCLYGRLRLLIDSIYEHVCNFEIENETCSIADWQWMIRNCRTCGWACTTQWAISVLAEQKYRGIRSSSSSLIVLWHFVISQFLIDIWHFCCVFMWPPDRR